MIGPEILDRHGCCTVVYHCHAETPCSCSCMLSMLFLQNSSTTSGVSRQKTARIPRSVGWHIFSFPRPTSRTPVYKAVVVLLPRYPHTPSPVCPQKVLKRQVFWRLPDQSALEIIYTILFRRIPAIMMKAAAVLFLAVTALSQTVQAAYTATDIAVMQFGLNLGE